MARHLRRGPQQFHGKPRACSASSSSSMKVDVGLLLFAIKMVLVMMIPAAAVDVEALRQRVMPRRDPSKSGI